MECPQIQRLLSVFPSPPGESWHWEPKALGCGGVKSLGVGPLQTVPDSRQAVTMAFPLSSTRKLCAKNINMCTLLMWEVFKMSETDLSAVHTKETTWEGPRLMYLA